MLPAPDQLTAFIIASLARAITPGADMTFIIASAAKAGVRGGLAALAGVMAGCTVHIILATAGLTALIAALPSGFFILKVVGAGYLVYMAYQLIADSEETPAQPDKAHTDTIFKLMRRGLLINILNPKVGLFFLAFLPQFIDPAAGHVSAQTFTLGIIFVSIGCAINAGVAVIAAYTSSKFSKARGLHKVSRWIAATLLGGFAVRLGFSEL